MQAFGIFIFALQRKCSLPPGLFYMVYGMFLLCRIFYSQTEVSTIQLIFFTTLLNVTIQLIFFTALLNLWLFEKDLNFHTSSLSHATASLYSGTNFL